MIRLTFRLGCVIGKPLKADGSGPADAFVLVSWSGAATPAAATASSEHEPRPVGRPRKAG